VAIGLDVPTCVGDLGNLVDLGVNTDQCVVNVVVRIAAHVQLGHQLAIDKRGIASHAFGDAVAHVMDLAAIDRIGAVFRYFAPSHVGNRGAAGSTAIGGHIAFQRNLVLRIADVAVVLHGAIVQIIEITLYLTQLLFGSGASAAVSKAGVRGGLIGQSTDRAGRAIDDNGVARTGNGN